MESVKSIKVGKIFGKHFGQSFKHNKLYNIEAPHAHICLSNTLYNLIISTALGSSVNLHTYYCDVDFIDTCEQQ